MNELHTVRLQKPFGHLARALRSVSCVGFGRRRAMMLFLTKGIGTPRFGLVEHVNAFVNEGEVGIHFVDFG
jgi:hypothetical protein